MIVLYLCCVFMVLSSVLFGVVFLMSDMVFLLLFLLLLVCF